MCTNNIIPDELLKSQGWTRTKLGYYKSSGKIKDKDGFLVYVRRRNLNNYIGDFSKKSPKMTPKSPRDTRLSEVGSSPSRGRGSSELTPYYSDDKNLPRLSGFSEYPSLKAIRENLSPCLLIGYDSEWQTLSYGREMLSWQFAMVYNSDLVEFIFLRDGDKILSLDDALACILDHLGCYKPVDVRQIRRYQYCPEWDDEEDKPIMSATADYHVAISDCRYIYRKKEKSFSKELIQDMPDKDSKRDERDWDYYHSYLDYDNVDTIKVCLVYHAGEADLTALDYDKDDILRHLSDIQGGYVSLQPVRRSPRSLINVHHARIYPLTLSFADTMCHAPAGKKGLKDLGAALGVEKIDIPKSQKDHMKELLRDDPILYMEYASTDSVITMLYTSALYGYHRKPPVTITSATARVMKATMMNYLKCETDEDFNAKYRGLVRVKHGKFKHPERPWYVEAKSLEPTSNDANSIQYFASQAYHGGYNTCTEVGYFPRPTYDYDLRNAYPTAMCLVPDIDWDNPVQNEIIRKDMTLSDFAGDGVINPITPFVGYIRFEFPDTCKYPCIPVLVDGVPVYPLTSDGMDGVYAAGPYIWLALKLGARIYCDRGYFLRIRYTDDYSSESRSLAEAVKQLVVDRNKAKREKGKGSLEELILKVMVNSVYGKIAQDVIQKMTWDAYKDLMVDIGCSSITNPVSAMMITSIVQVELLAAQIQINELGYMSCSVTTDGFISDCPEDILKKLDLYGLRKYMESARLYLTGNDPELWEEKHQQDDLINFTTRGNVSLRCKERDGYDGVCAHNSTKSGYESDSYEDRLWLMSQVLSRTGPVKYLDDTWPTHKELVNGKPFILKSTIRHIRMDYDLKRKPMRDSFKTDIVSIDGSTYEMAHFDTVPYDNIEEFRAYRSKAKLVNVMRTESDWDKFWLKVDLHDTNARPRNLDWAILNSCIMGHRSDLWHIPGLDDKTVDEKCDWINKYNTSDKPFKPSDWKNARRPERQSNMLPRDMISEKLEELINAEF